MSKYKESNHFLGNHYKKDLKKTKKTQQLTLQLTSEILI